MGSQSKHRRSQPASDTGPGATGSEELGEPALVPLTGVLKHFGSVARMPSSMGMGVAKKSAEKLIQILADTTTLRDLYKKHHWQVTGPWFYQFHLLFDKHFDEQAALVDLIAERIQFLGGTSLAMGAHVAAQTRIELPPIGREDVAVQLSRLLNAHEMIIEDCRRQSAHLAEEDPGTADMLVGNVLRTNELETWFLAEHLVDSRFSEPQE